jgi:hypothetical protein
LSSLVLTKVGVLTKVECQHATCLAVVLTKAERFHLRPATAGQAAPTSAWSCRHCLSRRSSVFGAKEDHQHCAPASLATRGSMPPPPGEVRTACKLASHRAYAYNASMNSLTDPILCTPKQGGILSAIAFNSGNDTVVPKWVSHRGKSALVRYYPCATGSTQRCEVRLEYRDNVAGFARASRLEEQTIDDIFKTVKRSPSEGDY